MLNHKLTLTYHSLSLVSPAHPPPVAKGTLTAHQADRTDLPDQATIIPIQMDPTTTPTTTDQLTTTAVPALQLTRLRLVRARRTALARTD